jgi:polysaccharide biosynthesis/export protein
MTIFKKNYLLKLIAIMGFSFCFVFSTQTLSQSMPDLDLEFLEGLDPQFKESLQERGNEAEEDLALKNLFRSETSIETNKIILKNIQEKLKRLSSRMDGKDLEDGIRLSRFGDAFFNSIQSSFMPINMPNLGSSYIVDVGDTFKILLTGKTNKELTLEVQRDGSLLIPQIGQIQVAGKSLQETQETMSEFMKSVALGVTHYLTLSEIRDVQVLLTGGIKQPGIYTLSGGSSILHALNVAGGISKQGSYRKVSLKRDGQLIQTFDLYDIFINGSFAVDRTLRSGDAIIVDPVGPLIPLSGGVVNEGLYEVLPSETVEDIIRFAGGFSEGFNGFSSLLVQRNTIDKTELITLSKEKINSFLLSYRDSILVPSYHSVTEPILEIRLEGSVLKPGIYYVPQGEKLSDVIARAGGYRDDAYPFGGALYRESNKVAENLVSERIYKDTINFLASNLGNPVAPTGGAGDAAIALILEEFKAATPMGRVISEFNQTKIANNPYLDISLEDQDHIVIPPLSSQVYLLGEFNNPGARRYNSSLSLKDYISSVGRLKKSSDQDLLIIGPDGNTSYYKLARLSSIFSQDYEIYPGTIIYAPRSIGKVEGVQFASVVAPILSSLAISLASLNSINN